MNTAYMAATSPAAEQLLDLIASLRRESEAITGDVAFGLAFLLHEMKLDSPGQWGNAYFRCPKCGNARDCDGDEFWEQDQFHDGLAMCSGDDEDRESECRVDGSGLYIKDLRLSEGWVDRDVCGLEYPSK